MREGVHAGMNWYAPHASGGPHSLSPAEGHSVQPASHTETQSDDFQIPISPFDFVSKVHTKRGRQNLPALDLFLNCPPNLELASLKSGAGNSIEVHHVGGRPKDWGCHPLTPRVYASTSTMGAVGFPSGVVNTVSNRCS